MKNISKEVFLNALACPTLGWLLRSGQSIEQLSKEALTLGEQFRMDRGIEYQWVSIWTFNHQRARAAAIQVDRIMHLVVQHQSGHF